MGKRDDSSPRATREFDTARLAALTKQPLPDKPASHKLEQVEEALREGPAVAVGRAQTIDDPLTTGLLAEVTRRSQTLEFDEDAIREVLDSAERDAISHPHTRRRDAK